VIQTPTAGIPSELLASSGFRSPIAVQNEFFAVYLNFGTSYVDGSGVKIDTRESPGGHTWDNWRLYLYQVAPKLFR